MIASRKIKKMICKKWVMDDYTETYFYNFIKNCKNEFNFVFFSFIYFFYDSLFFIFVYSVSFVLILVYSCLYYVYPFILMGWVSTSLLPFSSRVGFEGLRVLGLLVYLFFIYLIFIRGFIFSVNPSRFDFIFYLSF